MTARTAFDDTTEEVSGAWVTGRPPMEEPGPLIYIMVDDAEATVDAIVAHGGEIVQPIGGDAPEITARFRDPGGNVLGIYQQPIVTHEVPGHRAGPLDLAHRAPGTGGRR